MSGVGKHKKMAWVKVREIDDWGRICTYAGEEEITSRCRKVVVKFPDGVESEVKLYWEHHQEHVNDMGHESDVGSEIPYIRLKVHDLRVRVKLATRGLLVKEIVATKNERR